MYFNEFFKKENLRKFNKLKFFEKSIYIFLRKIDVKKLTDKLLRKIDKRKKN